MIRLGWFLAFVVLAVVIYRWWNPYLKFESKAWKSANWNTNTRIGMANYLIATGSLLGKTKAEVIELLGEPDGTIKPVGFQLSWYAGPGQSFLSFNSYFVISLDQAERVKECVLFEN